MVIPFHLTYLLIYRNVSHLQMKIVFRLRSQLALMPALILQELLFMMSSSSSTVVPYQVVIQPAQALVVIPMVLIPVPGLPAGLLVTLLTTLQL